MAKEADNYIAFNAHVSISTKTQNSYVSFAAFTNNVFPSELKIYYLP